MESILRRSLTHASPPSSTSSTLCACLFHRLPGGAVHGSDECLYLAQSLSGVWSVCPCLNPAPGRSLRTSRLERPLPRAPSHQNRVGSCAAVPSLHGEGHHRWYHPIPGNHTTFVHAQSVPTSLQFRSSAPPAFS